MKNKQLTRSNNDRMVAGVCAGIAEYFAVDTALVRLLFLVGIFMGFSAPLWLYLILWIILPTKDTKGSPIQDNVRDIKDTGKRIFTEIKSGLKPTKSPEK